MYDSISLAEDGPSPLNLAFSSVTVEPPGAHTERPAVLKFRHYLMGAQWLFAGKKYERFLLIYFLFNFFFEIIVDSDEVAKGSAVS